MAEIVSYPEHTVPRTLRKQVIALQQQAWPSDEALSLGPWHDPALSPMSVLLLDNGRVVAALDILSKAIVVGGQSYSASGLSAVVTDQRYRKRGYGRQIVEAGRDMIELSGADWASSPATDTSKPFTSRPGGSTCPGRYSWEGHQKTHSRATNSTRSPWLLSSQRALARRPITS